MVDYTAYYGVYTYQEPLIFNKIENYTNQYHRSVAYRRDPLFGTYITKLDEEIFSEVPIFEPDILGARQTNSVSDGTNGKVVDGKELVEVTASNEYDTIKREWQLENWSDFLISIFDKARVHRWCIACLYNRPPYWGVFGPNEVHRIEYDEHGNALKAKIVAFRHLPYSYTQVLKIEDEVEFGEDSPNLMIDYGRPEGRWKHSDDIEKIWDLAVQLRYIRNDIVRNSAKSSGFYFLKLGKGASAQHESKVHDTMEKANYGNIVAAPIQLIEDIVDIHPKNAQFSIEAYDKLLKVFGGACRLPLSFFNSETEKAGIGTENKSAEDILVNKKKRFVFGEFKTTIITLVEKRWGVPIEDVFPNIDEYPDEQYEDQVVNKNENDPNEVSRVGTS